MRTGLAHPLHCSTEAQPVLTSSDTGYQPPLRGSEQKGKGVFVGGEQVDVEGGWKAGAGRGGRGGRAS